MITHWRSTAEISALMAEFEAGTVSHERWTHTAHLTAAVWYLLWYGPDEATDRMRDAINRLNNAHGVEQTPTRGYHETLTVFYMWAVRSVLSTLPLDRSIAELTNAVCIALDDRSIPLRYYSKERLMSWEARTGFVEPDIRPFKFTPELRPASP